MSAMETHNDRVVIVGAGLAGFGVASGLRKLGHVGPITLLGEEAHAPYDRPPLSKQFLIDGDEAALRLSSEPLPEVQLLSGCPAVALDLEQRTVQLQDGRRLPWDRLVLATGTRPRMLPALATSPRVMSLRTLDDARALRQRLGAATRLLVVGGGPIGLELAAMAQQLGCHATVVEAGPRLMGRSAPALIAEHLLQHHRSQGVDIHLGRTVVSVEDNGLALLDDGKVLQADVVVVGIGVLANDGLAVAAGIDADDGIFVDGWCRTNVAGVFAVGDVTRQVHPLSGRLERMETWSNAQGQAAALAAALVEPATAKPYDEPPWYWSDQGSLRLQCAGLTEGDTHALRGDPASGSFVLLQWKAGRLCGVSAINAARDFNLLRRLLAAGSTLAPEVLAAPDANLRQFVQQAQSA